MFFFLHEDTARESRARCQLSPSARLLRLNATLPHLKQPGTASAAAEMVTSTTDMLRELTADQISALVIRGHLLQRIQELETELQLGTDEEYSLDTTADVDTQLIEVLARIDELEAMLSKDSSLLLGALKKIEETEVELDTDEEYTPDTTADADSKLIEALCRMKDNDEKQAMLPF